MATGIPYVMLRKEQKGHGTKGLIEGDLESGDKVLVVEDVITTAGSSVNAISVLRENGAVITDVMAVVDREGGGTESLRGIGVSLLSLIRGSEIVKGKQ
jgi:orotate phosphoribosyltransferase